MAITAISRPMLRASRAISAQLVAPSSMLMKQQLPHAGNHDVRVVHQRVCRALQQSQRNMSTQPRQRSSNNAFPSLIITKDAITAQGPFAETQATFMNPNSDDVKHLDALLKKHNMGVVAHYYMDAELQGTLSALQWPHVFVADSLAMGDAAVTMAKGGVTSMVCLGVDFMTESVKATLDASGYTDVPVYRLSQKHIGCSLASAAERTEYTAFLKNAAKTPNSLHVVYINTSLITKAQAQSILPTITCTSSNVLQTVLTAFSQVPGLSIWYGPDTYMGENIYSLLTAMADMTDGEIRAIHRKHDRASIKSLLPRFHYFKQGNCIVHHMFGDDVVKRVKEQYADAFHTAHLEVPGEMFELAREAQMKGRGVVGSTSNILNFITDKTKEAVQRGSADTLQFVLGTESGMVTSIVRAVKKLLVTTSTSSSTASPTIEIVFPVASEAMTKTGENGDMAIVPGVSGGEGCSTAGGCATCPFMKMNSLEALIDVVEASDPFGKVPSELKAFLPQKRSCIDSNGNDVTGLGVVPILHMRELMKQSKLSDELVKDVTMRCG